MIGASRSHFHNLKQVDLKLLIDQVKVVEDYELNSLSVDNF